MTVTRTTYSESDVQKAYREQERAMKKKHGSTLYVIALEDLIVREHIETVIRATFEAVGMTKEKS